ncbi:enoyl-CoA hydratase/isomerase family protein [Priestia filamentosa]|uniref:enoyl-CoA hydratase/isomerase family protein n=1 Tax=Priestia filamentosa TaxID=1402861 RepID=UPI002E1C38A5|nr:enoyl-CoA hydratase/isomerase family protein [Priestia filamentosa]
MQKFNTIDVQQKNGIGWITLNRPDKYNAFNEEMMGEIKDALSYYKSDAEVKVVSFKGTGKTFASGADILDLQKMTPLDALFPSMQGLYDLIYNYEKPTIAAIQGYAFGGGMELAAACDIRVASDNVKFGLPECKLGVMPGAGGTQRLVRLLGEAKVKELVFLGEVLDAHQAKQLGFVSVVSSQDELEETVLELAEKIFERGSLALRVSKLSIQRSFDIPQEVGLLLENSLQSFLFSTKDKQEGVSAFLEKRKPDFKGL